MKADHKTKSKAPSTNREQYWDLYVRTLASSLSNDLLSECTNEPNVTGAYVETWIRTMARNVVGHRFRVSTGAKQRKDIAQQLKDRQDLQPERRFTLGVLASDNDSTPWFDREGRANDKWLGEYWKSHDEPPVTRILKRDKPDGPGIMAFIYFLTQVASQDSRPAT